MWMTIRPGMFVVMSYHELSVASDGPGDPPPGDPGEPPGNLRNLNIFWTLLHCCHISLSEADCVE